MEQSCRYKFSLMLNKTLSKLVPSSAAMSSLYFQRSKTEVDGQSDTSDGCQTTEVLKYRSIKHETSGQIPARQERKSREGILGPITYNACPLQEHYPFTKQQCLLECATSIIISNRRFPGLHNRTSFTSVHKL